jgi:mono/diheme cytochrome c family protein
MTARLFRCAVALALLLQLPAAQAAPGFPEQEEVCRFDAARELLRGASALNFPAPAVDSLLVNGTLAWTAGAGAVPTLRPGDTVTLRGRGFGSGPDVDFSKLMIGNSRVLETDLKMFNQVLDVVAQVNYELPVTHSTWSRDILSWSDSQVQFRVPAHASKGPIRLQVQKRSGYLNSLLRPGEPHHVIDAQTRRVTFDLYPHKCDVVSTLGETRAITPINVNVVNTGFPNLVAQGRRIFWSYDFNIGLAHKMRNLDWAKIFSYKTTDPITREPADPAKLFGAYKTVAGEVPAEAINDVYFDPYPMANPIPGFLLVSAQKTKGMTKNTGWVGYRNAESSHPYTGNGAWAGFNCASCHGYRISYEKAPGQQVTKVFPGLPNPEWSMKWTVLGDKAGATTATFDGIVAKEQGPSWAPGEADIDKTTLLYYMPAGAGEHNIVRNVGEGSETDNDYQFSPIVIPNVTNHMPIRRSLSHTESYVGFEGSYIHSEEPDGAMGSMRAADLKALTAYMTTLDADDKDLINIGLYRWLKWRGKLAAQTGNAALGEGQFVQAGWQSYPGGVAEVNKGKAAFDRDCGSCHNDHVGANSNERMFRLDEVGRFFAPTIYQKDQQSIRVAFLRNMYWTQSRGLLSDGHVRNLEDLVHPERCSEGSPLYNQYYTLHPPVRPALGSPDQPAAWPDLNRKGDVFRVYRNREYSSNDLSTQRNRFIERHKYFVKVDWDPENYYWDYQKMRREYGPGELGSAGPIGLPAAPHPWCSTAADDVESTVQYVLTR